MTDGCVRIGRGWPLIPSSSDAAKRRSGDPAAPKAIFTASSARGVFALSRAAGSPGLRREDAACRRMTKEGMRCLVWIDELKRLGPFPQEAVDEGGLSGTVRPGEEDEGGHVFALISYLLPSCLRRASLAALIASDIVDSLTGPEWAPEETTSLRRSTGIRFNIGRIERKAVVLSLNPSGRSPDMMRNSRISGGLGKNIFLS